MIYLIIGNGRSGTCWLGKTIRNSGIETTIEDPVLFELCHRAMMEPGYGMVLARQYMRLHQQSQVVFCDKSHPNIWNVELLDDAFRALGQPLNQVKYIGIRRLMPGCVASHMRHGGCRQRLSDGPSQWDVPWRYLGITVYNYDWYCQATMLQRAVLRWHAHHERMLKLQASYTDHRLLVLDYERMVASPVATAERLSEFVGQDVHITDVDTTVRSIRWNPNELAEIAEAESVALNGC